MANGNFDLGTNEFKLLVQNNELEDALTDNQQSCAGNFTIDLPLIDLNPLLYLRSIQAQLGISSLTIDTLPITYSKTDFIEIFLTIPEASLFSNRSLQYVDEHRLHNLVPMTLHFEDYSTVTNSEAIDFVNDILSSQVNYFIIFRYLSVFLDRAIFYKHFLIDVPFQSKVSFTTKEITLLDHYIDISMWRRYVLHEYVCSLVGKEDLLPNIDFVSKIALISTFENETLEESLNLMNTEERITFSNVVYGFSTFHNVKLTVGNLEKTPAIIEAKKKEQESIYQWLDDTECLKMDAEGNLLEENKQLLLDIIESNKILIEYGHKIREILNLERIRLKQRITKTLFTSDFLRLSLDHNMTKCVFDLSPENFLVNDESHVNISFSDGISYVLGGKIYPQESNVTIGPIFFKMNDNETPHLTARIIGLNQRLFSTVRVIPKIIYFATDLVTSHCNDFWLTNSEYKGFHLLHSQVIDDVAIQQRFICSPNVDPTYYRIQRVNNILEQFKIVILDQNFRLCRFQKRTYTRVSLSLKPYDFDVN